MTLSYMGGNMMFYNQFNGTVLFVGSDKALLTQLVVACLDQRIAVIWLYTGQDLAVDDPLFSMQSEEFIFLPIANLQNNASLEQYLVNHHVLFSSVSGVIFCDAIRHQNNPESKGKIEFVQQTLTQFYPTIRRCFRDKSDLRWIHIVVNEKSGDLNSMYLAEHHGYDEISLLISKIEAKNKSLNGSSPMNMTTVCVQNHALHKTARVSSDLILWVLSPASKSITNQIIVVLGQP